MKIVTGRKGTPHVSSNDDQARNQATFGTESYVFNIGTEFELTVASANEIHIGDGEGVLQGVHFRIEPNTYDTVTIENGSQGMQRIDLIVARYEKDSSTDTEDVSLYVIKGEAVSSNPQAPSYNTGDILQGDLVADMPLYEVLIDGIAIDSVTSRFSVLSGISALKETAASLQSQITALNTVNSTTMTFLNTTVTLYKIGKIVLFQFFGTPVVEIPSRQDLNAGTLPVGYRPIVRCSNYLFTSVASRPRMQIIFNINGSVMLYNHEATAMPANTGWIRSFYMFITP